MVPAPRAQLRPRQGRRRGCYSNSNRTLSQSRHIGRPWPGRRPMEAAILFADRDVVDAGLAPAHQPVRVEFPLLVAVRAVPLPALVMPFILKTHRDAVVMKCPEILDQAIVELSCPFAGEEGNDRRPAFEKFRAVAPAAVLGIGERHASGIPGIPGIFGHAGLLRGGLFRKRWKRRTGHEGLGVW